MHTMEHKGLCIQWSIKKLLHVYSGAGIIRPAQLAVVKIEAHNISDKKLHALAGQLIITHTLHGVDLSITSYSTLLTSRTRIEVQWEQEPANPLPPTPSTCTHYIFLFVLPHVACALVAHPHLHHALSTSC